MYLLSKRHRWAIHLSRREFVIQHIQGRKNVFADVLAHRSKGYRKRRARQSKTVP